MASSLLDLWRKLIQEFGNYQSTVIQVWIERAQLQLNAAAYGNNVETATVWLAAHMLKLHTLAEAGKMPKISGTDPDAQYRVTYYGLQLLSLRETRAASLPTLISIL